MITPDLRLLSTLDPADRSLDEGQRTRAASLLDRVVATPVTTVPVRSWNRRRVAAAAAAAAALGVGSVLVPGLGGSGMAYATWSATPEKVAQRDLDAAARACRDRLGPSAPGEVGPHFDPATIPLVLSERRGDVVAVVFQQESPEDTTATCLVTVKPGSGSVDAVEGPSIGGSSGPAWHPAAGRFAEGTMAGYGEQAWMVSGTTGTGVKAVTIHLGSVAVTATVENGRYVAWGPGQAFTNLEAPSGHGGPEPMFTYDLTLADGTVVRDATPARPSGASGGAGRSGR